MITLDFQLFSIVEDEGFCALLNHLEPSYQISSHKYFFNNLDMYEKKTNLVSSQEYVAITTDIWSSRVHDSVISFIAHFITEDLVRK